MNFRQIKAIEQKNKEKLLALNPDLWEDSGIYIFTRKDELGIKYGYVGQAKHVLTRLAQHLVGYQHIDVSLKKHGLYSEKNQYGWTVRAIYFPEIDLNIREREFILKYANMGYQLRNKTAGGQDEGKVGIAENKPSKGYLDGKKKGFEQCQKWVAELFEKYLDVSMKDKPNKFKERALARFQAFLKGEKND